MIFCFPVGRLPDRMTNLVEEKLVSYKNIEDINIAVKQF